MNNELLLELIKMAINNGESKKNPKKVESPVPTAFPHPIGEYVIVRTRNEGINFGKLEYADKDGCVISEAQRIWYHKPKESSKSSWYEGVANYGLSSDSKISVSVEKKYLLEDYSITLCTVDAVESIKGLKPYVAQ